MRVCESSLLIGLLAAPLVKTRFSRHAYPIGLSHLPKLTICPTSAPTVTCKRCRQLETTLARTIGFESPKSWRPKEFIMIMAQLHQFNMTSLVIQSILHRPALPLMRILLCQSFNLIFVAVIRVKHRCRIAPIPRARTGKLLRPRFPSVQSKRGIRCACYCLKRPECELSPLLSALDRR